jgi:hypothetical protein
MEISATLNNGDTVTIVDIDVNGCSVYISYIDSSSNLKVIRDYLGYAGTSGCIIATSATI